jgi:hypothetical protein
VLKADLAARPAALHSGATIAVLEITTAMSDYVILKLIVDVIMVQTPELLDVRDICGHNVLVIRAIGNILCHTLADLLTRAADLLQYESKAMHVIKNG